MDRDTPYTTNPDHMYFVDLVRTSEHPEIYAVENTTITTSLPSPSVQLPSPLELRLHQDASTLRPLRDRLFLPQDDWGRVSVDSKIDSFTTIQGT